MLYCNFCQLTFNIYFKCISIISKELLLNSYCVIFVNHNCKWIMNWLVIWYDISLTYWKDFPFQTYKVLVWCNAKLQVWTMWFYFGWFSNLSVSINLPGNFEKLINGFIHMEIVLSTTCNKCVRDWKTWFLKNSYYHSMTENQVLFIYVHVASMIITCTTAL